MGLFNSHSCTVGSEKAEPAAFFAPVRRAKGWAKSCWFLERNKANLCLLVMAQGTVNTPRGTHSVLRLPQGNEKSPGTERARCEALDVQGPENAVGNEQPDLHGPPSSAFQSAGALPEFMPLSLVRGQKAYSATG